mmetsp:Transcript_7370/g.10428  ORF Transcript_7370/g.10428 Transcript_7370/m.10428 type:complete len:215 (+) Transcript_7370:535-1179(+)
MERGEEHLQVRHGRGHVPASLAGCSPGPIQPGVPLVPIRPAWWYDEALQRKTVQIVPIKLQFEGLLRGRSLPHDHGLADGLVPSHGGEGVRRGHRSPLVHEAVRGGIESRDGEVQVLDEGKEAVRPHGPHHALQCLHPCIARLLVGAGKVPSIQVHDPVCAKSRLSGCWGLARVRVALLPVLPVQLTSVHGKCRAGACELVKFSRRDTAHRGAS